MLTLSEAAKLANVSTSALLKSIKRGRLSAVRDDVRGQWRIDVSELSRVYPLKSAPTPVTDKPIESGEILAERVRALERLVGTLESERNDLRRRLDIEAEERRRLTLMLTHQIEKPHDTTQQPRSSLLEKLFGSRRC
jgi:excisionase family DNA binding protein